MGLSVSHDCWSSTYGTFTEWRRMLARAAGLPPLDMMEGYFREFAFEDDAFNDEVPAHGSWLNQRSWYVEIGKEKLPIGVSRSLSPAMRESLCHLPLKWDYFKDDPLVLLLRHSDCDGIIEHEHCAPLAKRLLGLLDAVATVGATRRAWGRLTPWGAEWPRERTKQFAEGLMRAHDAGEDVTFH